jgi:hypothetical protein
MKEYFLIQPNLVFISSVKINVKLTRLQSDYLDEQGSGNDVTDEGVEITPVIEEKPDLAPRNPSVLTKKLIFLGFFWIFGFWLSAGGSTFLLENLKVFYESLVAARSYISSSKILRKSVNRVSGLQFFFQRFKLPRVIYIPCFFGLLAGLVLVSGPLNMEEKKKLPPTVLVGGLLKTEEQQLPPICLVWNGHWEGWMATLTPELLVKLSVLKCADKTTPRS